MGMISADQFLLIKHTLSLSFVAMAATAVFLGFVATQAQRSQRDALVLAGIGAGIAAYHQFLVVGSWDAAFVLISGDVTDTGYGFDKALRLAGRVFTVPISVIALIMVLGLPRESASRKLAALGCAAVLLASLSYLGAMTSDPGMAATLILLATLPLALIGYEVIAGLKDAPGARLAVVGSAALSHLVLLASLLGSTGTAPIALGNLADFVGSAGVGVALYLFTARAAQAG
ncbi:MAG: hypothetical protein AAF225_09385 [Pseudomonadota bacterium]